MEYSEKARVFLTQNGMEPEKIDLETTVSSFLSEMTLGLHGHDSSIRMIPTYLTSDGVLPLGKPAAIIDAGGTNFRTALVTFWEDGPSIEKLEVCPMPGSGEAVTWNEFISFTAKRLAPLLSYTDCVGFCFSYPTEVTPERDGRTLNLTKQIRISGFEDRLICADLIAELESLGIRGKKIVLLNDTPAVLLSGAGFAQSHDGLIGLIAGTGTNTSCSLPVSEIKKPHGYFQGNMLINLESGSFMGVPRGKFDDELDAATADEGTYWLEKASSGAYLGELCRLTLRGAAKEGLLSQEACAAVLSLGTLTAPMADELAGGAGAGMFSGYDAALAGELCTAIFDRAARCICANLSAILVLADIGSDPARPALICADGSVIRRSRTFRPFFDRYMSEFTSGTLGRHVKLYSTENATMLGTAVAALLNAQSN